MSTIVYVSVGNSDDKLTQHEWFQFIREIRGVLAGNQRHGEWFSTPDSPWQNACWCIEFGSQVDYDRAIQGVGDVRLRFGQNSVAWAVVPETLFI